MHWIDDVTFEIDGVRITLDYAHGGSKRRSEVHDFTMMKDRGFLDYYIQHKAENFKRILEVGVYQGGSFVFLDKIFKPQKISAIELSAEPIPALDEYISQNSDRARVHYKTSQGDVARVTQIIDEDFGGVIDLVVDDASHFYELTKATFKTAFPRLRPDGLYIIEDWAWSFQKIFQAPDHPWAEMNSLANLVIDVMEDMVLSGMIEDVSISRHMMKIRRSKTPAGAAVLEENGRRGRSFAIL
jgi:predicted O-methyltransferase YrrM